MVAIAHSPENALPLKQAAPKTHTPEWQMQVLGYRYYSPKLGRWTRRDPIEERAGENVYGFGPNGPINGVDVDGRNWFKTMIVNYMSSKTADTAMNGGIIHVATVNVVCYELHSGPGEDGGLPLLSGGEIILCVYNCKYVHTGNVADQFFAQLTGEDYTEEGGNTPTTTVTLTITDLCPKCPDPEDVDGGTAKLPYGDEEVKEDWIDWIPMPPDFLPF